MQEKIERKRAMREIGELRFRAQAIADSDRIAGDGLLAAARVAEADFFDAAGAGDGERRDAGEGRDAVGGKPGRVPKAFCEHRGAGGERGKGRGAGGAGRCVEHGQGRGAGMGVLIRDEGEQGTGAEKDRAGADRGGLGFERDLRPAEAIDAGKSPARERHDAVGRAGGDDQRIEGKRLRSRAVQKMHAAVVNVPDERFGAIIDAGDERIEHAVQCGRLCGLETIEAPGRAAEVRGLTAIDLAAGSRGLVDDGGSKAGGDEAFGGARAGGAGAHDHDAGVSHGGLVVRIDMPSAISVEQARRRSPEPVQTQQSWQAAMRQKPARGPSANSL